MNLAIFISGNHAYHMRDVMTKKGIATEIVSTPPSLSEGVCSTALLYPKNNTELLIKLSLEQNCVIHAIYRQIKNGNGFIYRQLK